MDFCNTVTLRSILCQMQKRQPMTQCRGRFGRYLYDDAVGIPNRGAIAYSYRRGCFQRTPSATRCGGSTRSFFGPPVCTEECAPLVKPGTGGADLPKPESLAKQGSRRTPESEPESASLRTSSTLDDTESDPSVLADPNTTLIELTDSDEEPHYTEETREALKASRQPQELERKTEEG